jgi:hypothetical protein
MDLLKAFEMAFFTLLSLAALTIAFSVAYWYLDHLGAYESTGLITVR